VCLAGAVMARELDVPSYADCHPALFDEDIERKLEALEEFRTGWVLEALGTLGIDIPQGVIDHMPVVNYHINREGFYRDMRRVVEHLRSFGL